MPDSTPPTIFNLTHTLATGGVELLLAHSSALQQSRGRFRPVVCAWRRGGPTEAVLKASAVPTHVLNLPRRTVWTGPVFASDVIRIRRAVIGVAQREDARIICGHLPDAYVFGAMAARRLGLPLVLNLQCNRILAEDLTPGTPRYLTWKLLVRWAMAQADLLVAATPSVRDMVVEEMGVDPGKIAVVLNGVAVPPTPDEASVAKVRRELGIEPGEPVVTCIGRMVPRKGQAHLIEMMPALLRRVPNARLLLVGDGVTRDELGAQANRLGLGRSVIFAGRRDDARVLLEISNVFATASLYEGLSLALLDAMAARRPAVAVMNRGNTEVLEGGAGLLLEDRDPERMAAGIAGLLLDPQAAARLAEAGHARVVQRYQLDRAAEQWDQLFTHVLAGEKPRDFLPHDTSPPTVFNLIHTLATGGVERVVAEVSAVQQREGRLRPVVCAWRRGGPTKMLLDQAGVRTIIPNLPRHKLWALPLFVRDIRRIYTTLVQTAKDERADLIFGHLPDSMVLGALLARRLRIPLVLDLQSNNILAEDLRPGSLRHRAWRIAVRWAMARADLGIAVSPTVKESAVAQMGIDPAKVVVVTNGVAMPPPRDPQEAARIRREFGIAPEAKVLICVGRLVANKGQQFLLDMMPKLRAQHPEARLMLVGEGPNGDELRAQAARLNLGEAVIFAGRRDDVRALLFASDVFMTASIFEGISFALLEGMAAGLPAIASANDGNTEVLVGGHGILVEGRGADELAAAVCRVLDDAEYAQRLGEIGREHVRVNYSQARALRELEGHLMREIEKGRARRR
ncbi:MAG: glycosyltransferase family 4 protein [Planctomycetota bacterium]|nr:glycosyltransferase family 4 protein [Planctomycetota bacterium]